MSTQKVSFFSCPGSSCWGNEMQTWQLHSSPGKTELSTQVQRWLESLSGLSTIEHTSWKTKSTVEMTCCCRIWPHNLSEQGPRCCWGISAAARAIPTVLGGLFCLPWPFGLMVATGQTSVGEPKGNILSRTMISGYEGHVIKAPLGDKVFTRQSCVWWHHSSYLFLCDLMCAAIEPAISAALLFWPK